MSSEAGARRPTTTRGARALKNPSVRIVVALLFIAIPFAVVAAPFNMFVSDKSLKRLGALLLTAIVLAAYWSYVRIVEKRPVVELSGPRMPRELGAGALRGGSQHAAASGGGGSGQGQYRAGTEADRHFESAVARGRAVSAFRRALRAPCRYDVALQAAPDFAHAAAGLDGPVAFNRRGWQHRCCRTRPT